MVRRKPKNYREQDDTLSLRSDLNLLREEMDKIKRENMLDKVKWAVQALLVLGGLGICLFGVSRIVIAGEEGSLARAQERHRVEAELRTQARQECVTACENGGMQLQHARVRERTHTDGEHSYSLVGCSCIRNNNGHIVRRVLWNDTNNVPNNYCDGHYECRLHFNSPSDPSCMMIPKSTPMSNGM